MLSPATPQPGVLTLPAAPLAPVRGILARLRAAIGRTGVGPLDTDTQATAPPAVQLVPQPQLCGREVHVVEQSGNNLFRDALQVARGAADLRRQISLAAVAASIGDRGPDPVVIIDIDGFDSTVEAVNALLAFRAAHPGAAVVIGSAYFARHDFSGERRAIADASIRLPIGRAVIALAISSAITNNDARARSC